MGVGKRALGRADAMIEILYVDEKIVVCIKPCGVLSTDEAGGLPELLRAQLECENIRTVHRLDRVVGGVMVLARTKAAAATLSAQIAEGRFCKEYLAAIRGMPSAPAGTFSDLLIRDKAERKTYVTNTPSRDAKEAVLDYEVLERAGELSLIRIILRTGRTHQIRAQFSARGLPLVGDKKYGESNDPCNIALWSRHISFFHPKTGEAMSFEAFPPKAYPGQSLKA